LDGNGDLLAYNAVGSVVRIDTQTNAQSLVTSDSNLSGLDGGTVDVDHGGTIFVSVLPSGTLASSIVSIDPNTGAERTVSTGGNLSLVAGLVVFSNSATAATTTTTGVGSSPSTAVFGQALTFTATVSIANPGAGMATGTVQFQIDGSDAGSPVSVSTADGVTTASFSMTSLAVGSHTVTASYSGDDSFRSEEHTSELQSRENLVCRLLLEKKN